MLKRLGKVLYWAAAGISTLLLAASIAIALFWDRPGNIGTRWGMVGAVAVAAVLVWLAGRAARYVLSDE